MQSINAPSPVHRQFDTICAEVDDFEPLPGVGEPAAQPFTTPPAGPAAPEDWALDGLILAGLVTPY